jgi:hypothetical protein
VIKEPLLFNEEVLSLVGIETNPAKETRKVGDFGTVDYLFTVISSGMTDVVIQAYRPWEQKNDFIVIFKMTMHVYE